MNNRRNHALICILIGIAITVALPGYSQLNVNISFSPNNACSGEIITFSSTDPGGTPPYNYNWNFGDGFNSNETNPTHIYNAFGCDTSPYNVTLVITDSEDETGNDSKQVSVKQRPNPELEDVLNDPEFSNCDNNPTPEDPNFPIEIHNITQNTSCITEYSINWGNGDTPLSGITDHNFSLPYTYTQLGAFNLSFTAISTNGCTGNTTYIVKNQSNPAVGIGSQGATQGCAPQVIDFTLFYYELNSPGTSYEWDFGDGSPNETWSQDDAANNNGIMSHTYNNTSCGEVNNQFTATVTASNSCLATSATVSGIMTWTKPVANFDVNPINGCVDQTCFQFTNNTIEGYYGTDCTTNTTYSWDFGNGETSPAKNPPCQEYDEIGSYNITLTTNNACGESSFSQEIFVDGPPEADANASPTNGCADLDVYFTNQSSGNNISYQWTVIPNSGWQFIDGTNNQSPEPVIQFTNNGDYTVAMNVSNQCGNDSEEFSITVTDIPGISLPPIAGDCPPYIYVGNATYQENGSTITQYTWSVVPSGGWNFTVGGANSENPTIEFTEPGDYVITVVAINDCGEATVSSNSFNVGDPIQVEAGNDTTVCYESGNFQMNGDPPGGTWDGDHVTSGGIFSPVELGDFLLNYSRGTGNCMTEDNLTVFVIENPDVNAGSNQDICIDANPISLTATPSGGYWQGDGITDSIAGIFSPEIAGAGNHIITYFYTDPTSTCSSSGSIEITVHNLPTVNAGNDLILCNQPVPEQLTGFSPSGGNWTGTNVTSGGEFTPNGIGIFTLIYHYTSPQTDCSNSDTLQIEVIDPEPVFAGTDTAVCLYSQNLYLTGEPTGGTWSGQHVTSNGIFSPDEAGTFIITYSRGVGSCLTEDQLNVTVTPLPEVNAGIDFSVCNNEDPSILSGTPPDGFWAGTGIIDPNTGLFDPSIANPGNFTLSYSYTDPATECSNFDQRIVTIKEAPSVSVDDTTLCNQPFPEQLVGLPHGGMWSGQNVTPSGLYTPSDTGTFQVIYTFTSANGCSDTETMNIHVIDPDTSVNAGPEYTICSNEIITLSGSPPGGTWTGDDVSSGGLFNPSGPGNYTLTYNLGVGSCLTQDSTTIHVLSAPISEFTYNDVCFGEITNFTDQSDDGGADLISWWWEFGDGTSSTSQNPSNNYANWGTYTVKLKTENANSCVDSIYKDVFVYDLPQVSFGFPDEVCVNETISFLNYTTNAISYEWDFGDGNFSTEFTPQHIYTTPGSYIIILTAYSGQNCINSFSKTIEITGPPAVPHFEVNPKEGCGPLPIHISIEGSQYGTGSDYLWDFGNGVTQDTLHPPDTIIYYQSLYDDTTYYITFTSENFCDSYDYIDSIRVKPRPISDFAMLHDWDCTPVVVKFKNFSVGLPESYLWDFGDGSPLNDSLEPVHAFYTGDTSTLYQIYLITENECGTDTLTRELLVKPNTVDSYFSTSEHMACENDTIYFENFSTDTSFLITNSSWDFGDGETMSSWNAIHQFTSPGTFIVTLHVDNGCGHDDAYDTIVVNAVPRIQLDIEPSVCVGDTVYYSYSSDVLLAGKKWDFGDGDSSLLSNPFHVYADSGLYRIRFEGISAEGFTRCTGISEKDMYVKSTPIAIISPDTSGCVPFTVTFDGDSGSYHLWNFGDHIGFTSDPSHTFNTEGLYTISLKSEYNNMCKDEANIDIRVFPGPISDFSFESSGGYPEELTFFNHSTGATECFWDFGNGLQLDQCEVTEAITYEDIGDYTITLVTLNQYNCLDTFHLNHLIKYKGLFFPNAFAPASTNPDVNIFKPAGIGLIEYHVWIYDTYGNFIWESASLLDGKPVEGWDGKDKNGEIYPQDVYVWKAYAIFHDNTVWPGMNGKNYGTVTLIK